MHFIGLITVASVLVPGVVSTCTKFHDGKDRVCHWTSCRSDSTQPKHLGKNPAGDYEAVTWTKRDDWDALCDIGNPKTGHAPSPGQSCCDDYGGACWLRGHYKTLWCKLT
ncbi:hypothetical protein BKA56DRAFT_660166 [Ilyonectria sp. MPI-CAGE-AT-0026]|nr:hypothetical protein BKA56DRAFT_660166 [Ilyonectria sp. MPI-CAGE-AT-0026]